MIGVIEDRVNVMSTLYLVRVACQMIERWGFSIVRAGVTSRIFDKIGFALRRFLIYSLLLFPAFFVPRLSSVIRPHVAFTILLRNILQLVSLINKFVACHQE